jgi:signal peptidase I
VIRAFLVQAFSIPSGSMQPTLLIGDYLLVNKFGYGIRNPLTNKIWIPLGTPQRGDVVVFIFPQDHTKNYIRRVVGLPGDRIKIINKKVFINGQLHPAAQAVYGNPAITSAPLSPNDPGRDNLGPEIVPTNSYFVMGDNRDYSYDGQFWGFVPFDLIRGKALYIYFSQDQKNSMIRWERLGLPVN